MRSLIVLLVLLTACSQAPSVETIQTTPTAPPSETMFLDFVREQEPTFKTVSDRELVGLARDLCVMLDNGGTIREFWIIATSEGFTNNQTAVITSAGVSTYCPEHL